MGGVWAGAREGNRDRTWSGQATIDVYLIFCGMATRLHCVGDGAIAVALRTVRVTRAPRKGDYPVRLWDDSYEAQAVLCAFMAPALDGRVHWGPARTHWKLRLLLAPWHAPWRFLADPERSRPHG